MERKMGFAAVVLLFFLAGCAAAPVREEVKADLTAPVGKIEGNRFTGVRFPFNVSAPPGWRIATAYPQFMLDLDFGKAGLEESQVFLFNPDTRANVQIDFTPAGRYATFDQGKVEWLAKAAADCLESEFREDHGKNAFFEGSPVVPYSLKGVPYAAETHNTYDVKGARREHGWVYAFAEPYQIFIIYMVLGEDRAADRQAVKSILDSFEVVPKP